MRHCALWGCETHCKALCFMGLRHNMRHYALWGCETQYNALCSIGQFRKAVTKTHTGGNTTLHNTVRPRETTSHGFVTPDNHPVAYGRPRGTTGYHGRPRETTGDHGPGRCDLGNDSLAYGRPWETTEDHERPGETTGDHGRPRATDPVPGQAPTRLQ